VAVEVAVADDVGVAVVTVADAVAVGVSVALVVTVDVSVAVAVTVAVANAVDVGIAVLVIVAVAVLVEVAVSVAVAVAGGLMLGPVVKSDVKPLFSVVPLRAFTVPMNFIPVSCVDCESTRRRERRTVAVTRDTSRRDVNPADRVELKCSSVYRATLHRQAEVHDHCGFHRHADGFADGFCG